MPYTVWFPHRVTCRIHPKINDKIKMPVPFHKRKTAPCENGKHNEAVGL